MSQVISIAKTKNSTGLLTEEKELYKSSYFKVVHKGRVYR